MKKILDIFEKIKSIISEIIQHKGIPYLVGGTVRDLVLHDFNLQSYIKDIDIEIHNIDLPELENILKHFGHVRLVGKKFGVLKIDGLDIDWSLPRKDLKGRKPIVQIDPEMTLNDALKRRDLTINAMAIDLRSVYSDKSINFNKNLIIDPFDGLRDIKNKTLRAVDEELFKQDPLRFFRVMQFVGRFEMQPDEKLNIICQKMKLYDFETKKFVSKERIFEEIKKLFLKSDRPSLGIRWIKNINRLKEIFPEIYNLIGTKQKKYYHPEGDVFEHTMQALDAAAVLNRYENEDEKFMIMLAVLCHDFGKPKTTDEDLSSKGHEQAGVPIAKKFLKRITDDKFLIKASLKLVRYHTRVAELVKQNSTPRAYKRLALKLAPELNLYQLCLVSLADLRGRNPNSKKPLEKAFIKYDSIMENDDVIIEKVLKKIESLNLQEGPEEPVLSGRDLIGIIEPGPEMGELLKKAYKIQIEQGIKDKEELKKRIL